MSVSLEDRGVRELRNADGTLFMKLGARCGRCMEVVYGSDARAFHGARRCVLTPAVFVVVKDESERADAISKAMHYGGHSRADAEAIVKVAATA